MKRIANLVLNLFSLAISASLIKNSKFILIEDIIFGHGIFGYATIESIDIEKYRERVYIVSSSVKANATHANLIMTRAKSRGYKESKIVNRAFHGNLFLHRRFRLPQIFTFIETPTNFTHDELSNLGPVMPLTSSIDVPASLQFISYITLMNRSTRYKKINEATSVHNHRNFDFSKISKAIDQIEESEFSFVRIGQNFTQDNSNHKVNDLRSVLTADKFLDIAVQEHASAYFGADSGPVWIPMSQHKPVGLVDVIPLGNPFPTDPMRVICITKQIYSVEEKRLLSIPELASNFILSLSSMSDYAKNGLEVIDNSEEEVKQFLSFWLNHILRANQEAILEINKYMNSIRARYKLNKLPSIYLPKNL